MREAGAETEMIFEDKVYEFKRQLITQTLSENKWNQCRAAAALEMHRNTLTRYIRILRIQFPVKVTKRNAKFADAQSRAMTDRVDACIAAQHIR